MKKRTFILTILFINIVFYSGSLTVYAKQIPTSCIIDEESTVYSTNYKWIYKNENNKVYRRLYDLTHQRWIGDWELVP